MNTEEKLKLSKSLERTRVEEFVCHYNYSFSTSQWLEQVDDISGFGIDPESFKKELINALTKEFKKELELVVKITK